MKKLLPTLALALLFPVANAESAGSLNELNLSIQEENLPPPFSARYEVTNGTLTLGSTRTLWTQHADSDWLYESTTTPLGIAKLFTKEISDQSFFKIEQDSVLPNKYLHKQQKRNEEIHFNWKQLTAQSEYKDEQKTVTLEKNTVDMLAIHILVMSNIHSLPDQFTVPVLRKNRLVHYTFSVLRKEKLETPVGTFDTVVLERKKNNDDQTSHLIWSAVNYQGLPVQYEKREGEKQEYLARIVELQWPLTENNKQTGTELKIGLQ